MLLILATRDQIYTFSKWSQTDVLSFISEARHEHQKLRAGSPLMLNGKLKGHQELYQALVKVENMFATMNHEVCMPMHLICMC